MRAYLLQVLRERRENGDLTLRDLEATAGLDRSQLSRLERGIDAGRALERLDRVIDGYAEALHVMPQDIWREALERWDHAEKVGVEATRKRGRQAQRAARRR